MIPPFIVINSPWSVLPPGIHDATLAEIESRFAATQHRNRLFGGFKLGCKALKKAGCNILYLDGSFVTEKPTPNDYDVCWDMNGVDDSLLDPVFFDFSNQRQNQKLKYFGEYFPSSFSQTSGQTFLDFFQIDKFTGRQKGIVRLQLSLEIL